MRAGGRPVFYMRVIRPFSDRLVRIPLFWRFQIGGWLVFVIFGFPFKLAAFSSVTYVVCMTLFREPLGVLMTMGMRQAYWRAGSCLFVWSLDFWTGCSGISSMGHFYICR